jgi:hypothetical protein
MSNLMKIRLVGAEFHADDQEDRHIDITNLTVSFRNLANPSKVSPIRKYIQKNTHTFWPFKLWFVVCECQIMILKLNLEGL